MNKIGLLICSYNRPEYLRQCLASIKAADLSQVSVVMIVDDKSSDPETIQLINDFELEGVELIKAFSKENRSIKGSLLFGLDLLFNSCDVVTNLDGDAIVTKSFIETLLKLHSRFPEHIVSGFNCFTKNKDGSERHKVLDKQDTFTRRQSVGGINMIFSKERYHKWIRPAIIKSIEQKLNWDDHSCRASWADGFEIITSSPSCVQHIGTEISSMGHSAGGEPPDTAEDFEMPFKEVWSSPNFPADQMPEYFSTMADPEQGGYSRPEKLWQKLQLKNVTLICADGFNVERCIHAANISCKDIDFGAVKILSHLPSSDPRVIKIRPLLDKKDYSQFILKEIVNYVDTEFMLIFQYDGFVINAAAFTDELFNYDYAGAVWRFRPEKRTANGGASWRSKKMCELIRDDDAIFLQNDHIIKNFAEDHVLWYIYREYLENKYGFKIAPEELCERFSIEAYGEPPPKNKYNGAFMFHGFGVDFNDADLPYIPYRLPNRIIL